jgi:hypothetical protein
METKRERVGLVRLAQTLHKAKKDSVGSLKLPTESELHQWQTDDQVLGITFLQG